MKNGIVALVLCAVVACGFFLFKLGEVNAEAPVVDTTVYELMVCLNGDKPIFQGLVTETYIGTGYVKFTEATGLRRFIQGGTCILTKGTSETFTAAQVAAEAAQAAQQVGGAEDDTGTGLDEGNEVVEAE
jgi:hypothetical protein